MGGPGGMAWRVICCDRIVDLDQCNPMIAVSTIQEKRTWEVRTLQSQACPKCRAELAEGVSTKTSGSVVYLREKEAS
jgi:hypothetical protein